MSIIPVLIGLTGILSLAACIGNPESVLIQEPVPRSVETADSYRILDHKARVAGQDLPEWVQRYLAEDIPGIELMPQYQDSYVFVGEALGTNNKALEQWAAGFTVAQDLPQLVAVRVQARLTAAVSGSPDVAYGRYFEQVIKGAADIRYTGARKETDFWLLKRYTGEDDGADRDIYAFYVLVGIDKTALREQLNTILNGVQTDLTREQSAAITRLRDNFYNGF